MPLICKSRHIFCSLTLVKYNVHVQELAGQDVQIGDRIFNLQVQSPKCDLNTDQEIIDPGEIPSCPYQGLFVF